MTLIQKVLRFFNRKQKLQIFGLLVMMVTGAIFEALGIGLILPFIKLVQDPQAFEQIAILNRIKAYLNLTPQSFIIYSGFALLAVYVAKNGFIALTYNVEFRFLYRLEVQFAKRLLKTYLLKPYTFHLQKNTAELIRNLTLEMFQVFNQVMLPMLILISELMVISLLLTIIIIVDPVIATTSILILGSTAFLFYSAIRKKTHEIGKKHQHYYEQILKWINQSLGSIKETKILNREDFFIHSFNKNMIQLSHAQRYPQIINQLPRLFIETLMIGAILLIVITTQMRGQSLQEITPTLALFAVAAFRLMPSINRMLSMLTTIRYFKASLDVIYNDLSLKAPPRSPLAIGKTKTLAFKKVIELNGIVYQYPDTAHDTIQNISLIIPKGTSVAFVGPTGSGKTTLVDIILGLLKPTRGGVFIDGTNIQENLSGWQRNIGYIPQSIYLTDDTIRRNVALGIEDNFIDDKKVWKALQTAQLKNFIGSLPNKLETRVGERGVRLSGGERQRIGIARALYHDPEVLVMDEATSSLDQSTEQDFTKAIEKLSSLKTLIVIAHRITTVKNCNTIYRINNGQMLNQISYAQLIKEDLKGLPVKEIPAS